MSAFSQRGPGRGLLEMKKFVCATVNDQEKSGLDLYLIDEPVKYKDRPTQCSPNFYDKALSTSSTIRPRSKSTHQNVINISDDDSSDEELSILYEVKPDDEEVVILTDNLKKSRHNGNLEYGRQGQFNKLNNNNLCGFERKISKKDAVILVEDSDVETPLFLGLNSKKMTSVLKLTGPRPNFYDLHYELKYFCDICNIDVSGSKEIHSKSIAHIMKLGPKNTDPVYSIPNTNIGFQMLLKQGWSVHKGLGLDENGPLHPVNITPKYDRFGLGVKIKKGISKKNCDLSQNLNFGRKNILQSSSWSKSVNRINVKRKIGLTEKVLRQMLNK